MPNIKRHIRNFSWDTNRNIKGIVLHGTFSQPQHPFGYAKIKRIHMQEKGYSDIGYHFIVNREPFFGSDQTHWENYVEAGRPIGQHGAHCVPVNKTSIGICFVGGMAFDGVSWEDNYTIMQKTVAVQLIRALRNRFPKIEYCLGHREMQANRKCPGTKFLFEFDNRKWTDRQRTVGV